MDTTVTEWATSHGDLHWGNITAPRLCLLDWADWGLAPRGNDAACLWGSALAAPDTADRVHAECGWSMSSWRSAARTSWTSSPNISAISRVSSPTSYCSRRITVRTRAEPVDHQIPEILASRGGEQSGADGLVGGAVDGCPGHGEGSVSEGMIGRRGDAVGGELGLVVGGRE